MPDLGASLRPDLDPAGAVAHTARQAPLLRLGGEGGSAWAAVGGIGVWWSVVVGGEGLGAGGGRDRPALSVQVLEVSGCDSGCLLLDLARTLARDWQEGKV